MQFGHIGIKVLDIEKSKEFYTKVLGCTILKDYQYPEMNLVFLDAHGTIIELIYKQSNTERNDGPVEHLAFEVDNLDEHLTAVKTFGITDISKPSIVGKAKIVFFRGPNNERFEFVQRITK